jgi:hypothetical protein
MCHQPYGLHSHPRKVSATFEGGFPVLLLLKKPILYLTLIFQSRNGLAPHLTRRLDNDLILFFAVRGSAGVEPSLQIIFTGAMLICRYG